MATSQLVNTDTLGDFTEVQPEKLRVRWNPRKGIISVRTGFTRPGTPDSASPRSLKDLDLSYKMDLDFWDCFGREKKPCLITKEIMVCQTGKQGAGHKTYSSV